ncbi:MAG: dienelactone hydrolase family protein [Anaerolineales bacterium]|nr:dienelactone hydrolase family protein [Anaerolineales bacterium]
MSIQKSEIKLDVNGKLVNAYLAAPDKGGPGILFLHAWWGLKPFFKQLCDQLAGHGYVVLAPDLRDGQIATTIDEAKELMQKSDDQLTGAIVMVAKEHLHNLTHNQIGVIGFSMGAAWALVAASYDPDKIAATVLFYGAYPGMDFSKVKSKVLGHFCEVDEWEPIEGVREMEADMKSAGVNAALHFYPKVGHWFVESDRPEYDAAAAQLAWDRTFDFLKKNL